MKYPLHPENHLKSFPTPHNYTDILFLSGLPVNRVGVPKGILISPRFGGAFG